MILSAVPRRAWLTGALVLLAGVVALAVALAATARPTSSPPPAGGADPTAAAAAPSGAEPSSGPTGTPSPGSLDVVPAGEMRTLPAVPLDRRADFGTGLTLRVATLEQVRGVARGPGEIAGPAVRMTVVLVNRSGASISLEGVVVSVSYGAERTPAMPLTGPGGAPFGGTLDAGGSATARYVYAIPDSGRDRVRVVASYSGDAPAVALAGSVA
jgi:hypothetical protein